MQLQQHSDDVWTIEQFLSPRECEEMIHFSELKGYEEATVGFASGARMAKGIRNNDRLIYEDADLAARLWTQLQAYCPALMDGQPALGLNERFRFYRYEAGQRFKRHMDGRVRLEDAESRITFMVYLSDDFEGGQTTFEGCTIQPKAGTELCFIHEQKHQSIPIESGVKYVLRSDVMYAR